MNLWIFLNQPYFSFHYKGSGVQKIGFRVDSLQNWKYKTRCSLSSCITFMWNRDFVTIILLIVLFSLLLWNCSRMFPVNKDVNFFFFLKKNGIYCYVETCFCSNLWYYQVICSCVSSNTFVSSLDSIIYCKI